ncbi:MAG: hypothetical protein K940chlam9_00819 [Chlamydiae bacterium]|nr:hypothetical protein [Chlamydiota bacterium]
MVTKEYKTGLFTLARDLIATVEEPNAQAYLTLHLFVRDALSLTICSKDPSFYKEARQVFTESSNPHELLCLLIAHLDYHMARRSVRNGI